MRFIPNTLLIRTIMLIGLLLVVSLAAWLTLFSLSQREPRARQTAERLIAVVKLTRSALLAAQPEKRRGLLAELSSRQGIQILPMSPEESLQPPPASPYLRLVHAELQRHLGESTLLIGEESLAGDNEDALWVSFSLGPDDYWLVLPRSNTGQGFPWQWASWGLLTLILSLAGGWFLVARINRPLRQTVAAAARIGQGHFDDRLAEDGPAEIAALGYAFNRMGDDLAQLERDRALMLAGVSHDLRTPLARLRLAVEMSVSDENERALMIGDIEDMDGLTRQFLDFARLDSETIQDLVDLDALARTLEIEFRQRGQAVELHGTAGKVRGHAPALRRALVNLIENAWRYGIPPISLSCSRTPDAVQLVVTDHGTGVPEDHLRKISQPFYRVDSSRSGARSSGLGLAIVERIAGKHGGTLELSNLQTGGLRAEIRLPLPPSEKS